MNFTKIGETIISITRHYENSYLITVRSKVNIMAELSRLRIKNCKVVWKEMQDKDFMCAVRKIEPYHIHSIFYHFSNYSRVIRCWPNSAYQLRKLKRNEWI